ncbi:MAG: hypothetical protein HZA24_09675 [Nitrospirae bacterium]|nr:hypothetical protein [Nitrospirota bacterium]
MAKYDPLYDHLVSLRRSGRAEWTVPFERIEGILHSPLPKSARRHRAWWGNEEGGSHVHARAWMEAGWHVTFVRMEEQTVTFSREH